MTRGVSESNASASQAYHVRFHSTEGSEFSQPDGMLADLVARINEINLAKTNTSVLER